jgi:hypothetical protein
MSRIGRMYHRHQDVRRAALGALLMCSSVFAVLSLARCAMCYRRRSSLREPLVLAAREGDARRVARLLEQGADPDSQLPLDRGITDRLADWADSLDMSPLERQERSDWWAVRPTALSEAAAHGHTGAVELLLLYGADAEMRSGNPDEEGPDSTLYTPLDLARYGGHLDTVRAIERFKAHKFAPRAPARSLWTLCSFVGCR